MLDAGCQRGMLDASYRQFHAVSPINKVKTQPVNDQLYDLNNNCEPSVNSYNYLRISQRSQNFLTASPITIHNTDGLALKFNHLKEKSARYVSHKDFISQCIKSKLVPKGLQLTLESAIGNYDQDFIDNWYSNLKDFSLVLKEQIVSFCDKTIEETAIKISNTVPILKQQLEKKEYKEIKKTITSNEAATKKILHQRKF